MKILMVLESVFPQDERVEKEIASLLEAGHELRIATYSFVPCSFREEYNGYQIYRKRITRLMYKMGAALLVHPFYFAFWRSFIRRIYREWAFEALHIHDLPLARLGSEWKRSNDTLFVADQHEYYSDWIVKTEHYHTFPGKVVSILSNWKAYEKKHLRIADLVCTVAEPLQRMYIAGYGLESGKVIVVPNTPLKLQYGGDTPKNVSDQFTILYQGGLDKTRGLDVAIRALVLIKKEIPGVKMVLVGRENKHNDLSSLVEQFGLHDQVDFRGWVKYDLLPGEIDRADVCFFIPPANRDEIHNTVPTKIYQYLTRGKPVIVGSARTMKQFVESIGFGLSIDESNPDAFADAVVRLYRDDDLRARLAQNALKSRSGYYWENTVRDLVDAYERFKSPAI